MENPFKSLKDNSRHIGLFLSCLIEPERQGRIFLSADASSSEKISIAIRLWVICIALTLVPYFPVYAYRGLMWSEVGFLSVQLFISLTVVVCLSWFLDLSLKFRKVQTNKADTMLLLAVAGAPVIPFLGLGILIGEADLLRELVLLKKQGVSFDTILLDQFTARSKTFNYVELISSIGMKISIIVLLLRSTILADLLVPLYQCDRDKLFSAMGFAFAATIAVFLLIGNLGLFVTYVYLPSS